MKADLSRDTFRPEQRFARVVFPQGHALTEAELNEQQQIQIHRDRATALDVIGPHGTPSGDGFEVVASPDGRDLLLRPGRYYVGGRLVEGDATAVPVTSPAASTLALPALTIDGRPLVAGEWLEVAAPNARAHRFRITAIDAAHRRVTLGANDVGPAPDTSPLGLTGATARRIASYLVQPDWPRPDKTAWPAAPGLPSLTLEPGVYGAYLEVFPHHVTGISDPAQREVALGGVDGATRERTAWQLRLRALGPVGTAATCAEVLPAAPAGAKVAARAKRPATGTNPCIIEPAAQYRRLENQLYRVEIHQGGKLGADKVTFKWSRENGSVAMAWLASTATELTLATAGRDGKLGLQPGDWIELLDDQHELSRIPGTLVQIDLALGHVVRLKAGTATGSTAIADFPLRPRVRRWDHAGAAALPATRPATNDGYLALEDGVEVRFGDGIYTAGDHWLIPARTLTGDVEWPRDLDGLPIAQPSHHAPPARVALAVVEWTGSAMKVLRDCREQFPPLTHITAKDVAVEADPCERGWTTVQDALEDLCHDNDLEFHNQHLHGWGVVCGLQVQCMTTDYAKRHPEIKHPKEWAILRDGYAIHPTGADLRVRSQAGDEITAVDVAQLAIDDGVVVRKPDGTIPDVALSLWIDRGGGPTTERLHVEKYDPAHKPAWTELLEGTILVDIYNDLVESLKQLLDDNVPAPVGLRAKRLIALLNLFWQLVNQTHGRHIYLSGDPARPDDLEKEDGLLRDFFAKLKDVLQSKSFCAMFDDIAYPAYDVYAKGLPSAAPRPTTIFGKDRHHRIRVHPRRALAFTCTNDNLLHAGSAINTYDLEGRRYLASTEFPISGAEVQDVAFGLTGNDLYAIAWIGDAKVDSVFAVGTINSDGTIRWTGNQVQCSLKLVTLAVDAASPAKVFATARGKGVYAFDLTRPNELPKQVFDCRASGHLVATTRNGATVLYAGAHATDTNPVAFTHVLGVPFNAPSSRLRFELPDVLGAQGTGHDDLALVAGPTHKVDQLCAIVNGVGQARNLLVWNPLDPAAGTTQGALPLQTVDLGISAASRIAYSPAGNWSMITYEDGCLGRAYRPHTRELEPGFHPLQIGPSSVATDAKGSNFYVLNWASNTITVVPAGPATEAWAEPWQSTIDVTKLQAYRSQAIFVFLKALGRYAQFLKDKVCEHLLINCPKPEGKKVYLADISFKDGKIYQICNFHHRRYVHTFPTVEYWMSFIPVLPMLKRGVAEACSAVIAGIFDKLAPPRDAVAAKQDRVSVALVRHGATYASQANLKAGLRTARSQLGVAGLLGRAALTSKLAQPAPGVATPAVASFDVLDKSEAEARTAAEVAGVRVTHVKVVESSVLPTLKSLVRRPRIAAGDDVELLVDKRGKVVGMEKATAAAPPARERIGPAGRPAVTADPEAAALRKELGEVRAKHDAQAATIDELRLKMAAMEAAIEKLRG